MAQFIEGMRRRNPVPVDLDEEHAARDMENQVRQLAPTTSSTVTPTPELPTYVNHVEGANDIAKLTAQAVIQQYEACAKSIEALAEPVKMWIEGHQKALYDLAAAQKYIEDTAQQLREVGAATFERLQQSSIVIENVTATCNDVRAKIQAPV